MEGQKSDVVFVQPKLELAKRQGWYLCLLGRACVTKYTDGNGE